MQGCRSRHIGSRLQGVLCRVQMDGIATADRVQRLTQEMSVYHRTGGLLCFIGLWMLLRRRWTVPASGEDSPDDAVPAVEITAETEA